MDVQISILIKRMVALIFNINSIYEGTMPLDDLLHEVMRLKAAGKKTLVLSNATTQDATCKITIPHRTTKEDVDARTLVTYSLGARYSNTYFTRREAECMALLLRGKTINSVANILNLSPRTVEYYIKNMKAKIGCRTKFESVDMVHASDFLKNIDF